MTARKAPVTLRPHLHLATSDLVFRVPCRNLHIRSGTECDMGYADPARLAYIKRSCDPGLTNIRNINFPHWQHWLGPTSPALSHSPPSPSPIPRPSDFRVVLIVTVAPISALGARSTATMIYNNQYYLYHTKYGVRR